MYIYCRNTCKWKWPPRSQDTDHPQPHRWWIMDVHRIQPFLLFLQKWMWGYVLVSLSFFSRNNTTLVYLLIRHHYRWRLGMPLCENVILYNQRLPLRWDLGFLCAIQKRTSIKRLVANYSFRTNFYKKHGRVKRDTKWVWIWEMKSQSKKLDHFASTKKE